MTCVQKITSKWGVLIWFWRSQSLKKNMNKNDKVWQKWSQGYSNPGPLGKAWQEWLKSELATAGAAIHPCINIKPCYNIINGIFEFEKHARKLLLPPPIFNQPWILHFSMKLLDVNIKLDRCKLRNMMMSFNFIYFKLNMIKFSEITKNPKTENLNWNRVWWMN